jgi:hypothetical protein
MNIDRPTKFRRSYSWLMPLATFFVLAAAMPARAGGLVISAESVSASAGEFDVFLTNETSSAVSLNGFSFEVNVSSPLITFTDATINTTTYPYIFAGNSLFGPDILTGISNGGQTLDASDLYALTPADVSVGAGASVGLGNVDFSVGANFNSPATVSFTGFPATSLNDNATNVAIAGFVDGTISPAGSIIPEPSTLTLATANLAIFGALWFARRSRRKTSASA